MLIIRLKRMGRKNRPFYRVILTEKAKGPQGKFIEGLGQFNPRDKEKSLTLKEERITYWISKGAAISPTVYNLLVDQKIVKGSKIKATRARQKQVKGKENK